jgi:hypothetical protein
LKREYLGHLSASIALGFYTKNRFEGYFGNSQKKKKEGIDEIFLFFSFHWIYLINSIELIFFRKNFSPVPRAENPPKSRRTK